jgi:TolB-like protein
MEPDALGGAGVAAAFTRVAVRPEAAMPPSIHETLAPTAPPARGFPPGAVEAALARVLSSEPVRASRRSSDFLAFAVAEVLAGRGDRLKERTIAVGALGRGARFDPRSDPSVRVQARRVRDALQRYYAGPGAFDPLRIELPRGRYAPEFRANAVPALVTAPRPTSRAGIAVIALTDLTPGGGHDDLAQGLSETLVAGLSRCPECRVVGPITLDGWRDPSTTRPPAVAFVLMGSVRARGGVLRVCLRVVEAMSGEITWSRIFDHHLDAPDPFAVEDEIATEATSALCGHDGVASGT